MDSQKSKMSLLVIEDDEGMIKVMTHHLNYLFNSCVEVEIAKGIPEAWDIIYRATKRFDIIFLDLNLPPYSADQTILEIPKMLHYCDQVLVISGMDGSLYDKAVLDKGAIGFLSKQENLTTPMVFIQKIIQLYKAFRGPSKIEVNLHRLEEILDDLPSRQSHV